jgi:hypothetical protein
MEMCVMADSRRHRPLTTVAALLGGVLVLSACSGAITQDHAEGTSDNVKSQDEIDQTAARETSQAQIRVSPGNGSDNASISNAARVTVSKGRLTDVTMTTTGGNKVSGRMSPDKTSWKPDVQLEHATTYKVTATAEDSEGRADHENASFTTVTPGNSFIGIVTPNEGTTVGVGMPVSIKFDKAISDKSAVQKGITVTSSSGQQVVGHWFGADRLDFRPRKYWQEGSTVTLKLALDGVESAPGVHGVQHQSFSFHIGRNQVSYADAYYHQMKVTRDGKVIKKILISAGAPEHKTYQGQMVISEKFRQTRMSGVAAGLSDSDGKGEYAVKDVPHAMRLSDSGTFIHGNYWAGHNIFGEDNTSHGCVGLDDKRGAKDPNTPAAWFYAHSLIGDVIVVTHTGGKAIRPDDGLNDWNMPWSKWVAGSAT